MTGSTNPVCVVRVLFLASGELCVPVSTIVLTAGTTETATVKIGCMLDLMLSSVRSCVAASVANHVHSTTTEIATDGTAIDLTSVSEHATVDTVETHIVAD